MRSFEGRLTHSIVQSLYVPRSWGVEIPAALTTPALVLLGIAGNSRIAQLPPHGRDGPKTLKWSNRPYCRQAIAFATCYRPKNGTHSSCHESDYSRTLWSPHLDRPPEALAWVSSVVDSIIYYTATIRRTTATWFFRKVPVVASASESRTASPYSHRHVARSLRRVRAR